MKSVINSKKFQPDILNINKPATFNGNRFAVSSKESNDDAKVISKIVNVKSSPICAFA